jgi:hypothetical protein
MKEDLLSSVARLGREVGEQLLTELFGERHLSDEEAVAELVIVYSANQTACILRSLGLAKQVDETDFAHIAGYLADSTSALIRDLSGHQLSLSHDVVPNASSICLNAYIAMRREVYRAR